MLGLILHRWRGSQGEHGFRSILALLRALPAVPVCSWHSLNWTPIPN